MPRTEYIEAFEGLAHAVAVAEGTIVEARVTAILVDADRRITDLLLAAEHRQEVTAS